MRIILTVYLLSLTMLGGLASYCSGAQSVSIGSLPDLTYSDFSSGNYSYETMNNFALNRNFLAVHGGVFSSTYFYALDSSSVHCKKNSKIRVTKWSVYSDNGMGKAGILVLRPKQHQYETLDALKRDGLKYVGRSELKPLTQTGIVTFSDSLHIRCGDIFALVARGAFKPTYHITYDTSRIAVDPAGTNFFSLRYRHSSKEKIGMKQFSSLGTSDAINLEVTLSIEQQS